MNKVTRNLTRNSTSFHGPGTDFDKCWSVCFDDGQAHKQHRDMVRWYGGPFDPIGLDEERARFGMENMARRRRGPLASHRTGSRRPKR